MQIFINEMGFEVTFCFKHRYSLKRKGREFQTVVHEKKKKHLLNFYMVTQADGRNQLRQQGVSSSFRYAGARL